MKRVVQAVATYVRRNPLLARLAFNLLPSLNVRVPKTSVGPLFINLRQHRRFWLRSPFETEELMLGGLRRLTNPGDVVYDIGANIGLYVRFLDQGLLPSTIYAFEPMRGNRDYLVENVKIALTDVDVRILPFALSDRDGQERMQVDDVMSASAVLDSVTKGAASEGRQKFHLEPKFEIVEVARLDTALARESLKVPNVLKIDVEGAEASVLRGAAQTLKEFEPNLAIELHGLDCARDVFEILDGLNYHMSSHFRVSPDRPDEREYRPVTRREVEQLKGKYDMHYLFASTSEELLADPVEPYMPDTHEPFVRKDSLAPAYEPKGDRIESRKDSATRHGEH